MNENENKELVNNENENISKNEKAEEINNIDKEEMNELGKENISEEHKKHKKKRIIVLSIIFFLSILWALFFYFNNQGEEYTSNTPLTLFGDIIYEDGRKVTGEFVELHGSDISISEMKEEKYLMYSIDKSGGRLIVKNSDGNVIGEIKLNIKLGEELEVRHVGWAEYTIILPENTTITEFDIIISNGNISISEDISALTNTGEIYINDEKIEVDDQYITVRNTWIFENGGMLIPSHGIILTDGSYISNKLVWSSVVKTEYNLYNKDEFDAQIIILDDGKILLPSGDSVVITETQISVFVGDKEITFLLKESLEGSQPEVGLPEIVEPPIVNTVKPTVGSGNEENENNTDNEYENFVWNNNFDINIFKDFTELVKPGSTGSVEFKVENFNSFEMNSDIYISEVSDVEIKLPFVYRLKKNGEYVTGNEEWITVDRLRNLNVVMPKNSEVEYTLEWMWPYEGNDLLDTQIGINKEEHDRIFNVIMYFTSI